MSRRVEIESGGVKLKGIFSEPKGKSVVIVFHGFESTKDSPKYEFMEKEFLNEGFGFLRFDFRGCGESEGDKNDIDGRIKDGESAINFVSRMGYNFYLVGSSFGGALALYLASLYPALGVVSWCAPMLNFLGDISSYKLPPVKIIHGDKDEIVPVETAFKIFSLIKQEKKEILIVNGANHRFTEHTKILIDETLKFIEEVELKKNKNQKENKLIDKIEEK